MAQVPNLLDLFKTGIQDARVRTPASPEAKEKAKSGLGTGSLLPAAPSPSRGSGDEAAPRTGFHAKVEKSRAKLAARHRAPASPEKPDRPDAPHTGREAKTEGAKPASRKEAPERPDAPRRNRIDPAGRRSQAKAEEPSSSMDAPEACKADGAAATEADPAQAPEGLDAETRESLKQALAGIGIQADDEQLQDPAFLMEILRMLQAMPLPALPQDATPLAEGEFPAAIAPEMVSAAAEPAMDLAAAPLEGDAEALADALPAQEAPRAEAAAEPRKELARLLESRIAGLEQAAREATETRPAPQAAPASTPREWQGVQVRAHSEGPAPEPVPLADLDRLRVMQASAMQAASAGADAAAPRTELVLESDSADPVSEASAPSPIEAGKEAFAGSEGDAQADLAGRDGDRAAGAGSVPKEGAASAREAQAGPHFQHALDQARPADRHSAAGMAAEGRQAPQAGAVLDQIARKMASITRRHGEELSIHLSPEHLGKVRVSLEMTEGGMAARIAVENDSVRKQVEANLASLKDALKEQGVQLQGLEVSVDQRQSSLFNPDGSNAESFFRRQGRGEAPGAGASGQAAPFEEAPDTDTGRRWGYNTLEFIG